MTSKRDENTAYRVYLNRRDPAMLYEGLDAAIILLKDDIKHCHTEELQKYYEEKLEAFVNLETELSNATWREN